MNVECGTEIVPAYTCWMDVADGVFQSSLYNRLAELNDIIGYRL